MKRYMKFLWCVLRKKKSLWILMVVSWLLVVGVAVILPIMFRTDLQALWTVDTLKSIFIILIAVICALEAIFIFRSPVDDGTELLIVSKPIARRKMIASKFLWMLIVSSFIIVIGSLFFFTNLFLNSANKYAEEISIVSLLKIIFSYLIGSFINVLVFGSIGVLFCIPMGKIAALFATLGFAIGIQALGSVLPLATTTPQDAVNKSVESIREEYGISGSFDIVNLHVVDTDNNPHNVIYIIFYNDADRPNPADIDDNTTSHWLNMANKNSNIGVIQVFNVGAQMQYLYNCISLQKSDEEVERADWDLSSLTYKYKTHDTSIQQSSIANLFGYPAISDTSDEDAPIFYKTISYGAFNRSNVVGIESDINSSYNSWDNIYYYNPSSEEIPVNTFAGHTNPEKLSTYINALNENYNSSYTDDQFNTFKWLSDLFTSDNPDLSFNKALACFTDLPNNFADFTMEQANLLTMRIEWHLQRLILNHLNTIYTPFALTTQELYDKYKTDVSFKTDIDKMEALTYNTAGAYSYYYETGSSTDTLDKSRLVPRYDGIFQNLNWDYQITSKNAIQYFEYDTSTYLNLGGLLAFWISLSLLLSVTSVFVLARKDFK